MNKALMGAFNKGKKAYLDGKSENDNPYPDYRTSHGSVTFSRAFRLYWFEGFREAKKQKEIKK